MPVKPVTNAIARAGLSDVGQTEISTLPAMAKLRTVEARDMIVLLIAAGANNDLINQKLIEAGHLTEPMSDRAIREWRKKPEVVAALNRRTSELLQAGWASLGERVRRLGELNEMVLEAITYEERDPEGRVVAKRLVDRTQATMLGVQQVRENTKVIADMLDPKRFGVEVHGNMNITNIGNQQNNLGLDTIDKAKLAEMLKEAQEFIEGEIVDESEPLSPDEQALQIEGKTIKDE